MIFGCFLVQTVAKHLIVLDIVIRSEVSASENLGLESERIY